MKLKQLAIALVSVGLPQLAWSSTFVVNDIVVDGLQRIDQSAVLNTLPVKVGQRFDDSKTGELIQALYATTLYDDIRVDSDGTSQLAIHVVERPVIDSLSISGGKVIRDEDIRKSMESAGLSRSNAFNPFILNQLLSSLVEQYRNFGKNEVNIVPEVTPLPDNRVSLKLTIDEGVTTTITQINFHGNQVFSSKDLQRQMSLTTGGLFTWLTKSNIFSSNKFRADLDKITNYYHNNGYLKAQIANVDVRLSDDKKSQLIDITINEGDRYHLGQITLSGSSGEVSKELLQKMLVIKDKSNWYNRSQVNDLVETIRQEMGNAGYPFAQIEVVPMPHDDTHVVDFDLILTPGNKTYVHQINITGNERTLDEVIRREFRQVEGTVYDLSKIQRSKQRILQLGYFDDVSVQARPLKDNPNQVDLDVVAKDRKTGSLNASVGWGQSDGLVLSAGVEQNNLFGTGKSVNAQLSYTKVNKGGSISFTEPYFTENGISLGYDLYLRRYDPHASDSNRLDYRTDTIGGGARLGVPVGEYDRVNFGLGVERLGIRLYDHPPTLYKNFVDTHGDTNWIIKGSIGWGRNTTDNGLWPTKGYVTSVYLDSGLPGGTLQYYGFNFSQKWFIPLSRYFTLMLSGEFGYANGYGKTKKLPFFQNYYGGGIGSVRGYENNSLGPKFYTSYDNRGNIEYSNTSSSYGGNHKVFAGAELLFPLPGIKDQRSLRLSLFADAGSIWDGVTYSPSQDNPYKQVHQSTFQNELRYSVGAAVTWLSPLGPLKFSYAYPIRQESTDKLQRFQFQLGTVF